MGMMDRLRRRQLVPDDATSPMPGFQVTFDDETRFTVDEETLALMRAGTAQRTAQEQYLVLDMLAEEGRASTEENGFSIPAEELVLLDDDEARVLGIPPRFTGKVCTTVRKWTADPGFRIEVTLQGEAHPAPPDRRGPVVTVDGKTYRASVPLLRALRAIDEHEALQHDRRTETENVRLVARLQAAQRLAAGPADAVTSDPHFQLSLGALDRFSTVTPSTVGITVEPQPDGSLVVEPDLGPDIDRSLLTSRWHQIAEAPAGPDADSAGTAQRSGTEGEGGVLRAEATLVLLGPKQLDAVREVRRRPRIPAEDVAAFLEAPGSFYDPDRVDLDLGFSVRVVGLGVIAPVSFTEAAATGLDWFANAGALHAPEVLATAASSKTEHATVEGKVEDAWERGESVATVGERLVDVSDRSRVREALESSRRRIEALDLDRTEGKNGREGGGRQVTVGMHIRDAHDTSDQLRARARLAVPAHPIDYAALRRDPYPHQREGIEWMTGLMQSALASTDTDPARVQGALLADDMGLGKTFMTLAALGEAQRSQVAAGREPLPVLGVMPVALLDTWREELSAAFGSPNGPFTDVVVLQGPGLQRFRMRGAGPETAARVEDLDAQGMVRSDRIHVALRVGPSWQGARLDRPGVLVLTTYDTLRRYQVSLGLVDWGVVVFDEAQATKNPEILATRAAKGLKARFKLLATGTPVENSLRDFWSLIDTAQPGLLGTWAEFHTTWVAPMEQATGEEHQRLGRALRDAVGPFMLRRIKEDHLPNLPAKQLHEYPRTMPAVQVDAYDAVLADHRRRAGVQGAALKTLQALEAVSLHPGLRSGALDGSPARLDESARTLVTVRVILDQVRTKGEKAIVFAKRKELQRALALWLGNLYGLRVDVVNGDTAATGPGETRMTRIRAFEARPGFNVIIMSPLAAGVGLTVVGANHAIHLERHWNPAKEAQATDRIYRIGQKREVHVHYPIALHPSVDSFDVNLDRLLRNKVALKDAVVVPQEVAQAEMERALGLVGEAAGAPA